MFDYARVSTDDQNLDAQTDALTAAGAERIFSDKISGSMRKRPELDKLLDQLAMPLLPCLGSFKAGVHQSRKTGGLMGDRVYAVGKNCARK